MNTNLIADIWNVMSEHIPEKEKKTVATEFINTLLDYGVSENVIEGLYGIDTNLDEAVDYVVDEENEYEDFDDEEEDRW